MKFRTLLLVGLMVLMVPTFLLAQEEEEEPVQPRGPQSHLIRTTNSRSMSHLKGGHYASEEEEEAQALTAPHMRGSNVMKEDEEAQSITSPFAKNSQTMRFMTNTFGSFSMKQMQGLKAGKKMKMTARQNVRAGQAGFNAKKGQSVMVSMKKGGFCLEPVVGKNKLSRGAIMTNGANNKLNMTSNVSGQTFSGMMHTSGAQMQFNAKPMKGMR
jgi:hypothetical protein